jgi:hypothetical protein
MTLIEDFKDEMVQSVTISTFKSNDGYADSYNTAATYACAVEHKVENITKEDGTVAVSTMQIQVDGAVSVSERDKVVYGGVQLKVLAVGTEYDIEFPLEIYAKVIYS